MAFFAESTVQESYQELDIVVNEYTDFDTLALEACDTIQEMDNAIMAGIGRYELDMVREGVEVVYTEGMVDTIKSKVSKIWEFIKNWVKSVWNKFVAWVSSYVRGDKAFLAKYKKQIEENLPYLSDDFEYTMKYGKILDEIDKSPTKSRIETIVRKYLSTIQKADATKEKLNDIIDNLEDELKDLKEDYKSEDLTKEVDKNWVKANIKKVFDMIDLDASKIKREADDNAKFVESLSKDTIKNIEDNMKLFNTPDGKAMATLRVDAYKSLSSKASSVISWQTSFMIKAFKGLKSDCRAICRKALTAKPNPKYNESAFEHKEFGAYFDI